MATPCPQRWKISAIASTVSASARVHSSSQSMGQPRCDAKCYRRNLGCLACARGARRVRLDSLDAEGVLHLLEEALVLARLHGLAHGLGQPLEELPLFVGQLRRRHD